MNNYFRNVRSYTRTTSSANKRNYAIIIESTINVRRGRVDAAICKIYRSATRYCIVVVHIPLVSWSSRTVGIGNLQWICRLIQTVLLCVDWLIGENRGKVYHHSGWVGSNTAICSCLSYCAIIVLCTNHRAWSSVCA